MSRARSSTRGNATPARAARAGAGGRQGIFVTTPKSDVYVALLGVALGSMILAILFLAIVWSQYDFKTSAT